VSFYFLDSSARSAWLAATTQQAQLEALAALWSGDVWAKFYSSAGTHLATVTYGTPTIDTGTTPRAMVLGAWSAEAHYNPGTATYCILQIPSGADILRADVSLAGAISDPGGRVRVDIGTTLRVQATAGLPATAMPAWRTAMTVTDRVYYLTAQPPGQAPSLAGLPSRFGRNGVGTFGAAWDVMSGYSSGQLLDDVGGPFGTMVYGTGGHEIIANQLLGLNLNDDAPVWDWWQLPNYQTADVNGADLYYSPAEEAALVAGPRGTAARIRVGFEVADVATWDKAFPVAFAGWIFPRKLTTGQMGNQVPHGFRYSSVAYVPASMTGTDAMYFAITGAQGPFSQNAKPAGATDAEWFDASVLISGNRRKFPYYFQNCRTKAWTQHLWQPDGMSLSSGFSAPPIGVFRDIKRIYVCGGNVAGPGYYYIDMSAGFAGQTVSAFISTKAGGGSHVDGSRFSCGAFSEGDPLGRHFMVTNANDANTTKLAVYDFDANNSFLIDLAAAGFTFSGVDERMGFSYDPVNRRVLILMAPSPNENTPFYWSITVPSDLTNSAGWVASKRFLTFDDAAMATTVFNPNQDNQNALAGFYGKTRLHPLLGTVLVPSADFRNVAFVPSI